MTILKMSDKVFNDSYEFLTTACTTKSTQDTLPQQLYPYSNIGMNSYTPHFDMYNAVNHQPYHHNQMQANTYMNSEHQGEMNWDSRLLSDIEKSVKAADKIDLIELTSKDFSPASYCSNIDLLIPDYYKNGGKDSNAYNKFDNNWLTNTNYSNQRNGDYPSCAQVTGNNSYTEKTARYCSIQKDFNEPLMKYCEVFNEPNIMCDKNSVNRENDVQSQYCSYLSYQNKDDTHFDSMINHFYNQNNVSEIPFPMVPVEQHSELSNEESDIIVEESDDDVTDVSEDQERGFFNQVNKCVICNLLYTPVGTQFYFLTTESPLTMSSQKPVFSKIIDMVGPLQSKDHYLCNQCLGLINTIDHLQLKLQNFYKELRTKFKKTCFDNNITYSNTNIRNVKKSLPKKRLPNFKCKICRKVLSFQQVCMNHLHKHKRKFLCELCGKMFATIKNFKIHLHHHKIKKRIKIDPFKCSNCPKYFRTKSNLKEHENYCLGILPYRCKHQSCDKKFASSSKLKSHIKLKHDKKFIAICSICNIGFVSVNHYKSHKISHSTDKKYACNKCDKSYKTLSNLNFHMKVHQEKLPFICEICNKGFMRKEYLDAHVNNHKGIKNFCCPLCDKKFVSQKNLDSHLKYHDGTVKKKNCNVCGKWMTTGYEEHLRIHSNLLEFECDLCDKKFNTKGTLSKHKKLKHNSNSNSSNSS